MSGLLLALVFGVSDAQAAGGAHIVDDSEVETPGVCHLETWVARYLPGNGYFNVSPACTTEKMPFLEIGAALQHYWDETINAPLFGPAIKVNFQPATVGGVGIGLDLTTGVNLRTGDLGLVNAIALVTLPLSEGTNINLNAGWSYLGSDHLPNAYFYGAQIETKVAWDLSLMLEVFGRANSIAGVQMGVRFTPKNSWFDFDFLAGSFLTSDQPRFFTVGVTVRY